MPIVNPDPLRYPGAAPTTGGTSAPATSTAGKSGSESEQIRQAATVWLQQQPWYRATLAKWGNPSVLTLGQRGYLARTAQQAGLDSSLGVSPDGTVEDWSTPTGAKIALAAFGAWAGGTYLGAFSGGPGAGGAGTGADVAGANALPASGVTSGLPGASATGGTGGVLSTAQKLLGFNKNDPNSYLKLAGAVGDTLGAAGQGAAQGRILQTELNQGQDRLAQEQYQNQLNAPGKIAGNSVRGDILANAKDFSYGAPTMVGNIPVPTSTGGLRPSIFSDSTRALGARQTAEAATMPGPPSLTPMDEAGAGTSILNTAGAIGSFADLLNPNNYKTKIPYQRPAQGQVA